MVYTSGVIRDITIEESLEQLQDNKMTLVCEKVYYYNYIVSHHLLIITLS